MKRNYQFTKETESLIKEVEDEIKKEERNVKCITKEELDFANKLIKRYDEVFGETFDGEYEEVWIYGEKYLILPEMTREIKEVVKAINTNSFDNRACYKCYEENGEIRRKKAYKPYRIKRLAQMLRVAKEANYTLFESFIKIPDVYYVLNVIKANRFGYLDIYMGIKTG